MDSDERDPPKTEYEPYLTPMQPYVVLFVVITAAVLFAGWLFSR
ncbi:MAG TPA: hypothetical protein VK602_08655 [Phyllobacterium sp.]|nr:hypothetical protein [Phyllobacterium sp.]